MKQQSSILLVIILAVLHVGCDSDSGNKLEITNKSQSFIVHEPSEQYPQGAYEENIGTILFKIPNEYLAAFGRGRGSVTFSFFWPGMQPNRSIKKFGEGIEEVDRIWTAMRIQKRPPLSNPEKYKTYFDQRISRYHGPAVSEENPELLFYWTGKDRESSMTHIFTPRDKRFLMPDGERWIFRCQVKPLADNLPPRCNGAVRGPDDLNMEFRFFRKHIADAKLIIRQLLELRDSWVVEGKD